LTATDQVVKIIKRSKKGVDVPTLKKKTGFEDKKIRNILNRSSKQGKIKGAGRGVYVAT
jgi:predicted transcriptional regulator of viral defense system